MQKIVSEEGCQILQMDEEDGTLKVTIGKKVSDSYEVFKVKPIEKYPAEEGCFLRGNDFSPVAVVVTLNAPYCKSPSDVQTIPSEIEKLVKSSIETGAALAGTLQTENIGIEKIVCNVVGNPNIRFLVLCGRKVEGHSAGDALRALLENGIDERRVIVGSKGVTPYLFNISLEAIERFRKQVSLVNLLGEADEETIRKAVWICYQEKPTQFRDYTLCDPGAYNEQPIYSTLTWKVKHPESIEDWELDDIAKRVEKDIDLEDDSIDIQHGPVKNEGSGAEISESNAISFIGKRLLRISEELADIAELCGVSLEKPKTYPKETSETRPTAKSVIQEDKIAVEEDEALLYFANRLRAYNGVFAAFEACADDICNNGCTFPAVVISTGKKLKKLRGDLENLNLPREKKEVVMGKIDGFLERLNAFPQDRNKPCQKTLGNCTIGAGCFVNGALDLLKQVSELASPISQ